MITTTTRIHMNPKEALGSLEHVRNKRFRDRESHVDAKDGEFELWQDTGVYETYSEIFGDVLESYNSKQKRKDRQILDEEGDAVSAYIQQIQDGRRGVRERVVYKKNKDTGEKEAVSKKKETQGQRVLYELIASAGNCEKERDASGRIVYTKDGHEIHPHRLPEELHKRCLKRFFEEFEKMYPHFRLCTVAYHADEFYYNVKGVKEKGISHLHLCFIPFATGYKRGLPVQASISKALQQMGFSNGEDNNGTYRNAYYFWTQDVQKQFERIIQEEAEKYYKEKGIRFDGIKFEHPAAGKALPNLDPAQFRAVKDMERRATIAEDTVKNAERKAEQIIRDAETKAFKRKGEVYGTMRADVKKAEDTLMEAEKKMKEADKYYEAKKKEADFILEDAEIKAQHWLDDTRVLYEHDMKEYKEQKEVVDKIIQDFLDVMEEDIPVPVPDDAIAWMQKKKIMSTEGKKVSIYDMYVESVHKERKAQEKKKLEEAERLQKGIEDGLKKHKRFIDALERKGWDEIVENYDDTHTEIPSYR